MLCRKIIIGRRFIVSISGLCFIAFCGAATAQNALPPPSVSVTPVVSRQVTETGNFIGRVTAIDKVDIVARVPGFIERRYFTEGQQVKTGDLLFRIEQATYKAAVQQQRANLAKAQATEVNAALQLQRGRNLSVPRPLRKPWSTRKQPTRPRPRPMWCKRKRLSINPKSISATRKSVHPSMGRSELPNSPLEIWSTHRPGNLQQSSAETLSTSPFRRASVMFSSTGIESPNWPTRTRT